MPPYLFDLIWQSKAGVFFASGTAVGLAAVLAIAGISITRSKLVRRFQPCPLCVQSDGWPIG
jgi:hypothetical protein